ncbi:MAG: hypothetical protein ACJ8CR_13125 [Roseiflexaceae bacterium]
MKLPTVRASIAQRRLEQIGLLAPPRVDLLAGAVPKSDSTREQLARQVSG